METTLSGFARNMPLTRTCSDQTVSNPNASEASYKPEQRRGELPLGGSNRGGNVREGIVHGGEVPGGESAGGNCPGLKCPRTNSSILCKTKMNILQSYDYIKIANEFRTIFNNYVPSHLYRTRFSIEDNLLLLLCSILFFSLNV